MSGNESAYPRKSLAFEPGMTKREMFAMSAMQGFCANPALVSKNEELLAAWSVDHANALIDALNSNGEPAE
jgi:hypothetical protein